jgi:hypothetical protein
MRSLARSLALALLLASTAAVSPAEAQSAYNRIDETRSSVAYFYHARPGVPTLQVSVWGTVPRPGIYEVPEETGIARLMTMAGGAAIEARSENEEATSTIRVFREQRGGRELIYESSLQNLLRDARADLSIQNGDVLVVATRVERSLSWRDVLSIVGSVGSLALVVERLFFR